MEKKHLVDGVSLKTCAYIEKKNNMFGSFFEKKKQLTKCSLFDEKEYEGEEN